MTKPRLDGPVLVLDIHQPSPLYALPELNWLLGGIGSTCTTGYTKGAC